TGIARGCRFTRQMARRWYGGPCFLLSGKNRRDPALFTGCFCRGWKSAERGPIFSEKGLTNPVSRSKLYLFHWLD
ncbi:hypothetical protein, partial [Clostridium sp.]|uniref:hypothetical protein n=1 Tax=Clostridium sp. TaxID=1506 RepID=UPI00307C1E7F